MAPYLYSATDGWMWLIFGIIVTISMIIIIRFMKETRGLSEEEVKELYRVSIVDDDF